MLGGDITPIRLIKDAGDPVPFDGAAVHELLRTLPFEPADHGISYRRSEAYAVEADKPVRMPGLRRTVVASIAAGLAVSLLAAPVGSGDRFDTAATQGVLRDQPSHDNLVMAVNDAGAAPSLMVVRTSPASTGVQTPRPQALRRQPLTQASPSEAEATTLRRDDAPVLAGAPPACAADGSLAAEMICADDGLRDADRRLSATYRRALALSASPEAIAEAQEDWLDAREDVAHVAPSRLGDLYDRRLYELEQTLADEGAAEPSAY